jgi:sec-independent protein translocase protein TatB
MFGLSFGELVIVAVLALVLLGPDRLPEAAKTIGKTIKDLKKATDGLKDQIETELYATEKSIQKMIDAPDVPPVTASAMAALERSVGPSLPASVENVPGLEAALVDPAPTAASPAAPPAAQAPAPGSTLST